MTLLDAPATGRLPGGFLSGLMQPTPLTLRSIFERMRTVAAAGAAVGYEPDGTAVRRTWGEVAERSLRLAAALRDMGVGPGDRVASYGMNTLRHLELYWAVPLLGAVLHTVNVRLHPEQVVAIVEHAGDKVVFVDDVLPGTTGAEVIADLAPRLPNVERWVLMGTGDGGHDALLAAARPLADHELPDVPEEAACGLCYTSGTTGMPKGVLSSHRAMWLHSMATCMADAIGLVETDRVLPVVPMFHAFGWGLPWSAPFAGADLVLHGTDTSPAALGRILSEERITVAAGVPTIWKELLPSLQSGAVSLPDLRVVFVGGSASPRSLIGDYQDLGIGYLQVWGMTETGPLACASRPRARHLANGPLVGDALLDVQEKTGTIFPGIEARIVSDDDEPLPWDGVTVGELEVRGPWIAGAYYEHAEASAERFHDGWLRTGDMASVEHDGLFRIVDRAKDLVKSGGEWISSVELEGRMLAHPDVVDAAVVGVRSRKWDERPVMVVVPRPGAAAPSRDEVRSFLSSQVAKWWLPDEVVVVEALRRTSVGKIDKKAIRADLAHLELP